MHLKDFAPDWIVGDHYGLDATWESMMRGTTRRIAVLDDLADRRHDCDLLVDAGRVLNARQAYDALIPKSATLLSGLDYCVIHPRYAALRTALLRDFSAVKRVLLYFGTSDPTRQTARWLEAIRAMRNRAWHLDLVIGRSDPQAGALREAARAMDRVSVHENLPDLAELIAGTDMAIGATGGTSFERCCLGLPALAVVTADNQREAAEYLAKKRALLLVDGTRPEPVALARLLESLPRRVNLLRLMSARGSSLVDGLGVNRIATALLA